MLLEQKERLLSAILLGNNLVNILASALATRLFLEAFGETGVVYATLVMTVMVVVFAEVLPKTYAILAPDITALRAAGPFARADGGVGAHNPLAEPFRRRHSAPYWSRQKRRYIAGAGA